MFLLGIVGFLSSLIFNSYGAINAFIKVYGYVAIFVLMALESSTIPVPSEVVLPLAGAFAANGTLNFYMALLASVLGSIVGTMVDYAIGYVIGKDIVYKHLKLFHVKKETLDSFDSWFEKNGVAAVFLTRLVPVVRTVINFPAGFARMNLKEFLAYTVAGIVVWDVVLMAFGYYVLSVHNATIILAGIGVFAILLYIIYRYTMGKMKKHTGDKVSPS
ncbi:MAG: DedA family protein [Candidatus Micrarchaeota archaeon]|nr:DedA family protein [Candidatus Micrarchaeota archaeon]